MHQECTGLGILLVLGPSFSIPTLPSQGSGENQFPCPPTGLCPTKAMPESSPGHKDGAWESLGKGCPGHHDPLQRGIILVLGVVSYSRLPR